MEYLSAIRTRRGSIGLDGAESHYCDLSVVPSSLSPRHAMDTLCVLGRGLATAQIERTLRVFETAEAIDLSNNEIERIPSTIPTTIVALDLSFNLVACAEGIDRLKDLQEVHLGFNRLMDVSVLEFCPRLQRVNLSGNRLMNTRGLETLVYLENLDLSENLIEFPEALRPLSLNQNLTHLALRGNPIALNPKNDYRVLLFDMIPSVLVLDDKKIRSAVKHKQSADSGGVTASKSLSYSRLYDDKKQFIIQNRNRPYPGTRVKPLVAGDSSSKYDGTMFLQPAAEPSHECVRSLQLQQVLGDAFDMPPPPQPLAIQTQTMSPSATTYDARATASGGNKGMGAASAPPPPPSAPYMSLYDRLAQANGTQQLTKSAIPPSKPIESRQPSNANNNNNAVANDRLRRQPVAAAATAPANPTSKPRATGISPSKSAMQGGTGSVQRPAAPARSIPAAVHDTSSSKRPLTTPAEQQQYQQRANASAAAPSVPLSPPSNSRAKSSGAPGNNYHNQHQLRDEKQRNVLSVIQNLIQHKKQTLATLSRASAPMAT